MEVERLEIYPVSIPYRKPFAFARGMVPTGDHVLLRAFAGGLSGWGEAAVVMPDKTGEWQASIVQCLRDLLGPALLGEDPFALESIFAKMDRRASARYAFLYAKAAVDSALYDLMGKAAGVPASHLIGGRCRERLTVGRALSMGSPEEMAEAAVCLKEEGYRALTVKVDGRDYRLDVQRVEAVRRAVGEEFPMDVDPNQSYPAHEALPPLRRMEALGISGVEQPCSAWDLEGMARLAAALDVPVAADESLLTPADAHRIVRARAADVLTLKLAKSGGFYYSKRIVAIGEAAGLGFWIGSMHTFGVGTAAIHHFASATPEVAEPIGYGSPLDRFADDILAEPIRVVEGVVEVPSGPGLGVAVDEEKLKRYAKGCEVVKR